MKFSLNITLGSVGMSKKEDVARALRAVASRMDAGCAFSDPNTEGAIMDQSTGELVGCAHFFIEPAQPKPKAVASGLLSPSFWLIARGSMLVPKLDVALFDRDKEHAINSATRMTEALHAAGYRSFALVNGPGTECVATLTVQQPPAHVTVERG